MKNLLPLLTILLVLAPIPAMGTVLNYNILATSNGLGAYSGVNNGDNVLLTIDTLNNALGQTLSLGQFTVTVLGVTYGDNSDTATSNRTITLDNQGKITSVGLNFKDLDGSGTNVMAFNGFTQIVDSGPNQGLLNLEALQNLTPSANAVPEPNTCILFALTMALTAGRFYLK